MNRNLSIHLIEYISLTLVLSFYLFHNIYLVFVGISFSLLTINKNILLNITRIYKVTKKSKREILRSDRVKTNNKDIKLIKEDPDISLVNKVEELGFIPSINQKDDSKVA